jgi:hypothetical protein
MTTGDPGSFRDPASRIVHVGDRVVRLLDERGLSAWVALAGTDFHDEAVGSGALIASEPVDVPPGWESAGAIEHPRLSMVTYPYEWTFSMLKDAALLQLDLLESALKEGITMKDATPYNIQFVRGRPQFIDIGSFEPYRPGEPWLGYRQFTRQFLFPLMMRAWLGLPFQPWLRGDMEGPTAGQMRGLLGNRRRLNPAALLHVRLQARMEQRAQGRAVRQDLGGAGFNADMIIANTAKLRKAIESLVWDPGSEGWSSYQDQSHVGRDRDAKAAFLSSVMERTGARRVLDLGANDGHFSRIAAGAGATVVAVDSDEAVLDNLYRGLAGDDISIAVSDLTSPSPSQGWAGVERPSLADRARPDLVVAYGLIHHLVYTSSVPPELIVDWLRSFGCDVAIEFVAPEDEMVAVLTANKMPEELHGGRTLEAFEQTLGGRFMTVAEKTLDGGTRSLLHLSPR